MKDRTCIIQFHNIKHRVQVEVEVYRFVYNLKFFLFTPLGNQVV